MVRVRKGRRGGEQRRAAQAASAPRQAEWTQHRVLGLAALLALGLGGAGCKDDEAAVGDSDLGRRPEAGAGDLGPATDARVDLDLGPDAAPSDLGPDPDGATRPDGALTPDAAPTPDAAYLPPFRAPTLGAELPAARGWRVARGLMHLHSIHSHDACDGRPKPDGVPDAECLRRLRAALCVNRYDFVMLTDHPASFVDVSMEEALLISEGDAPIHDGRDVGDGEAEPPAPGSVPIASWLRCAHDPQVEGAAAEHQVLLTVGSEGDLMPMMFRQKPPLPALRDLSAAGSALLRDTYGAVVLQSHTEMYDAETIDSYDLDGFEIYNIHANLDPRGPLGHFAEVLPDVGAWLLARENPPHPDLAWLAIFRPNHMALDTWDTLTPRKRQLGFAGSDIHENIPLALRPADGDRVDSYRRLGAWFSNYLLVSEVSFDALEEAVAAHRLFVTFDLLGAPTGLDVWLQTADGLLEIGGQAEFAPSMRLHVTAPTPPEGSPIEVRLYRIDGALEGEAARELVRSEPGDFVHEIDAAGVYRVEVWQTPEHLRAAVGPQFERFIRPMVWIYTNPIYLRVPEPSPAP